MFMIIMICWELKLPNLLTGGRPSDDGYLSDAEQQALVSRIGDAQSEPNINDWEDEFLASCLRRVQARRGLSERQLEILERIEVEVPLRLTSGEDFNDGGYSGVF